jgi:CBS-domain-containing membrane protein
MPEKLSRGRTQYSRLQELIYELKVGQVMTRKVITVHPGQTMGDVKELLRFHRIS